MASQSHANPGYDSDDQQVRGAGDSAAHCRMLAVNSDTDKGSREGHLAARVVPVIVNGLGHAHSTESDEGTDCVNHSDVNGVEHPTQSHDYCVDDCVSHSGAQHCLNGFVSRHFQAAAALPLQSNSFVCNSGGLLRNSKSVSLGTGGVLRSNGNGHYSSDEDVGLGDDSSDQLVPEARGGQFSSDGQNNGAKPKRSKRRNHLDERHSRDCVNGLSPSDEEENGGKFARKSTWTCAEYSGFEHGSEHIDIMGNGSCQDSSSRFNGSRRRHQRHNNHSPRQNNVHYPEPPIQRQEEDPDLLDMVDEGAVCDFDRNVFVDENSYCFPEDPILPTSVAHKNIGADYQNGHLTPKDAKNQRMRHQRRRPCPELAPHFRYCFDSDDDSLVQVCPEEVGLGGLARSGAHLDRDRQDMGEDNGDFIDADLPAMPGQLLSSSADSASLSSSNGDLAEQNLVHYPGSHGAARQENNLSGGSDKELNHRPDSPDAHAIPERGASFRTSYSSHDGGFDNFLTPHELSSSDGVFDNSSESENEEELSETLPLDGQDELMPAFEGAGVAEATAAPHAPDPGPDGHHFGAVGDLCFHFDSACNLRENEWQPEHTASGIPSSFLAGHSAARHDPCSHDPPIEEAGGACAPSPPVNNLSRLHPITPAARAMESMANGLDDVAPSNFINDESNRQQKVFVKFPMVQDGREGACGGSGAVQAKCEVDNGRCPCPAQQVSAYNSSADTGLEPDQANMQGTLGPNVESFGAIPPPDHKHLYKENGWMVHESGVAEPIYEEICDYPESRDTECGISYNALHPVALAKKASCKEGKKKRVLCRPIENGVDTSSVDRVMIWNEYEAYLLQVKQIGLSACGQTAVLNLLKAFELPAEKKDVCCKIHVNLRKEKASVAEYLASRAVAGTTAEELLAGVERLTKGEIRGRFFHVWPPRDVQLLSWISDWMKKGAVPIATLNLQLGVKQQQVPDAWHHQMVYGVGPRGVYLTNPLEIVPEDMMMEQLSSDSVLLVRRQDVVSRFQPTASLAPLMHHQDPRWCTMNVLGQVVNVLREHNMPSVPGYRAQVTSHIRIPAVYRAGIALYVRHNTEEWKALRDAPDLPLKRDRPETAAN